MKASDFLKRRPTAKLEVDGDREFIGEDRPFFCSELVAKAFKVLGVIESDSTSCSSFYPSHFSKKGQPYLKLREDTVIEQE